MIVFLLSGIGACAFSPDEGLQDQVGTRLRPGPVRRVVALAPDVTEIAFALGVGDRLVAVPPTANYPEESQRLPHINPANIESILAHRPDLVLATTAGNDPRIVGRLTDLGVRTFTVDPTSLRRVAESFLLVSEALGVAARGRELEQTFSSRVARARAHAATLPPRTAVFVVWWQPFMVAGQGTFHHDVLAAAGLANLAPGGFGRYPRINLELLLDPRLDTVVVPDEFELRAGYDRLAGEPVGRRLISGEVQVLWLTADPASRPGPRLVEALEQLVELRSNAVFSSFQQPPAVPMSMPRGVKASAP